MEKPWDNAGEERTGQDIFLPSAPFKAAGMQINKSLTCCTDRAGPEISAR